MGLYHIPFKTKRKGNRLHYSQTVSCSSTTAPGHHQGINQRTAIEVVSDDEKNNIDILPQDSTFKMDPKVILEPKRIQDKKKLN